MVRDLIGVGFATILVGCSGDAAHSKLSPAPSRPDGPRTVSTIGKEGCGAYDSYLAALGELTADCLGTVDPRSYEVGDDGAVRPTFRSCPQKASRYPAIRQLLSLQQRGDRLPGIKACFADHFREARSQVEANGIETCPRWTLERRLSEADSNRIEQVIRGLPHVPAESAGPADASTLQLLERQSLYRVNARAEGAADTFDGAQNALQNPRTDELQVAPWGEQAKTCASAFPGFVLEVRGNQLRTDPVAWMIDTIYPSESADPYLRTGYYHPMCYSGPPPGVIFGAAERAQPCGPLVSCLPELCCYYAGSAIKTRLQMDCVDPADPETCVSYCGPKLP